MGHTPAPFSRATRGVGCAATGLLALALAGVPATSTAAPAVTSLSDAAVAAKPGTKAATAGTIKQLRTAVKRGNKRDGTQRIQLTRDIDFERSGGSKGGAG